MNKNPNTLDAEEFEVAWKQLNESDIEATLRELDLDEMTVFKMIFAFIVMMIFFILFIMCGIRAFALGGSFGAVINSLIPVGNFYYFYKINF